jgi:hypothetical protein
VKSRLFSLPILNFPTITLAVQEDDRLTIDETMKKLWRMKRNLFCGRYTVVGQHAGKSEQTRRLSR